MKTSKMISILAGLLLVAGSSEAVVNIQNVGAGARSQALGNSVVAVVNDADAVFENPAGLGQLENSQLVYTNVSLLYGGIEGDDLGQHVLSYVQPLGSKLGLGLGFEHIGSNLMSENGGFLSLSYKLTQGLSMGLSAKFLYWKVGTIPNGDPLSGKGVGTIGADLGLMWKSPFKGTQFGLMVKNLNQPGTACDCSDKVLEDDEERGLEKGAPTAPLPSEAGKLPMDLHVGVGYQLNAQSLISVQYVRRDLTGEESDSRLVVGGEMTLAEGLMLRAGGSKIFEDDVQGALNAGLGYEWGKLLFDYAYRIPLDLTETNGAHRFSFAYDF